MSQAKLAELVELTPNYVGLLERGEALPTVQTLLVLAKALDTTAGRLLGNDDAGQDEWIERLVALGEAVPPDQRELVLALVQAVNTAPRTAQGAQAGRRSPKRRARG